MSRKIESRAHPEESEPPSHRLRLPGFITGEETGLGDVIQRTSAYFGIQPCKGCARRSAALNRWLVFTNRRSK